ncbi:MAG TPA: potassium channel family protein [Burkholderiales bacterium]
MRRARDTLSITLHQRCFYLFCALLLVLMSVPFLEGSPHGRIVLIILNLTVLVSGAAAIGGLGSLVIGVLLAVPAALCMVVGQVYEVRGWVILSNAFSAAFYFITVSYLLSYALRRDVLTMDKLYGAAAGYLMLGALWTYFYVILLWFHPGALALNGIPVTVVPPSTMLYFSFVTLTSTGMSDLMAVHPIARILCVFEMVVGVLFIAVLIARLAGGYPPREGAR